MVNKGDGYSVNSVHIGGLWGRWQKIRSNSVRLVHHKSLPDQIFKSLETGCRAGLQGGQNANFWPQNFFKAGPVELLLEMAVTFKKKLSARTFAAALCGCTLRLDFDGKHTV